MKRTLLTAAVLFVSGCTSNSTRMAIQQYESAEQKQQVAFDNAYRIAQEQLFQSTVQFVHANQDNEQVMLLGLQAAWKARSAIEEARVQYLLARSLGLTTYGHYLYDQQGFLNVLFEDASKDIVRHGDAVQKANAASGSNLSDIIQGFQK